MVAGQRSFNPNYDNDITTDLEDLVGAHRNVTMPADASGWFSYDVNQIPQLALNSPLIDQGNNTDYEGLDTRSSTNVNDDADLAGNTRLFGTTIDIGPVESQVPLDVTAPQVTSVTRQNPTDASTIATSVTFRVIMSEDVMSMTANLFSASTTGSVTTDAPTVTEINASTYDVTVATIAGNGTLGLI